MPRILKDALGLTESEFLEQYDATAFERPSLAIDICVLTVIGGALKVALYRRDKHPQMFRFALPGGFLRIDESLDDAASRLLRDKVGIEEVYVEQLSAFGAVDRDPRTRIVTIAYFALVSPDVMTKTQVHGSVIADVQIQESEARISIANEPLQIFTDHDQIVFAAVQRLRDDVEYRALGYQLLPKTFTLRALQEVHEAVHDQAINKDSFRRKVRQSGAIEATGERVQTGSKRPAALYRFKPEGSRQ